MYSRALLRVLLRLKNEDMAGAVLDLEDNGDQWSNGLDEWKIFLKCRWSRLRYLQ